MPAPLEIVVRDNGQPFPDSALDGIAMQLVDAAIRESLQDSEPAEAPVEASA